MHGNFNGQESQMTKIAVPVRVRDCWAGKITCPSISLLMITAATQFAAKGGGWWVNYRGGVGVGQVCNPHKLGSIS